MISGIADARGFGARRFGVTHDAVAAGHDRHAGGGHLAPRLLLFAHQAQQSGEGPMNVMCEASQTSAKLAFSERNP